VIVSHQAQTLEQFATQAAVLRDGQFIQFDTLEEARQVYDFETQAKNSGFRARMFCKRWMLLLE
jgi:ABC-type polysaccharide/polyol phosphate transport system ATPase subunit